MGEWSAEPFRQTGQWKEVEPFSVQHYVSCGSVARGAYLAWMKPWLPFLSPK